MVDKSPAVHTDDQPVEWGSSTEVDRDADLTGVAIRRGAYTGEVVVRVYNSSGPDHAAAHDHLLHPCR